MTTKPENVPSIPDLPAVRPAHWACGAASLRAPGNSYAANIFYPSVERLLRESSKDGKPVACFGPEDIFVTYERFVAPTLYAERRYLPGQTGIPNDCSIWISRPAAVPRETGNFEKVQEYTIQSDLYYVYRRK